MDRIEVEREVIRTLRQCALNGSDREISLNESIGQLGIGLDSLSLLEFILGLEKTFDIKFSDGFWTERGQLVLQDVVDAIMVSATPTLIKRQDLKPLPAKKAQGYAAKMAATIREKGLLKGLAALTYRLLARLVRYIYEREKFVILSRGLSESPCPEYSSLLDLTFRVIKRVDDFATLNGFWETSQGREKIKIFNYRFQKGYICLTASHHDKIIGVDWLSASGDHEPLTDLTIKMQPGTCYGLDLDEHCLYQGKGVGLALLAYSLAETQKRGFHTQVTIVSTRNVKMLSAATALFGYKKNGHIVTTRIFRKPRSRWQVGEQSGYGPVLLL
ncbi:MAG: hypothetical protein ALAOOOJD_03957 [bacterium]|nr:hypothetical protein [bacterium]